MIKLKKAHGADVILQVKDNQRTLRRRCVGLTTTARPRATCTHTDNAHGRKETRTTSLFIPKDIDLGNGWRDVIMQVIRVERTTVQYSRAEKQVVKSHEVAHYITTTDNLSVTDCARVIRAHWRIENSNHYVRDVTLKEDFSRVRKKPENVARLRSFALNVLRANGVENVSQTLYRNAMNPRRMFAYKGV